MAENNSNNEVAELRWKIERIKARLAKQEMAHNTPPPLPLMKMYETPTVDKPMIGEKV